MADAINPDPPGPRRMPAGPLRSRTSLVRDLRRLGLGAGDVVLLHVSMRGIGWVIGGAQSLIAAFLDVLGPEGTLCMPGHSAHLSDPGDWENPPVPRAWHEAIRDEMPVFDPATTPLYGIGAAAEMLWRWPGTRRSHHPQVSMLAWGRHACFITETHPLEQAFGSEAPLGRVHDLGAKVVLLGVGYRACTALHLVEYSVPRPPEAVALPVSIRAGRTQWVTVSEPETLHPRFVEIGRAFEAEQTVARGLEGAARMLDMQKLVRFGVGYIRHNP